MQPEVSQQDLSSSAGPLAGGGELGALMRAVDWSRTALGPVELWPQALRTSVRIMLTSRQPMFVWWGDELINLYNDAYKSITGGKHPWALGQPAAKVWREIWDQVEPRARQAMTANEGTYDEALLLIMERHGYQEETYYTFSYSPVPSDTGETGGILCADTEEAAREGATHAMEALRRANADLEQFAFSASHDLQEPLRMVSSFSQLLQMKYAGRLDGEADTIIGHCVEGATRMGRLIQDLLKYTRAATISEAPSETVDLNQALEAALSNLRTSIEESKATVSHEPLPSLKAEPVHLQQIFQNLVSNAIKYRSQDPPRIHVGAIRRNGTWEFSVRDNGICIEPRYQEQVFGLFKRLHGSRYSGTGLGLAICKKLVERYHGRIWVESKYGDGAIFFFTMQASE
jgi:signal transduction histidine kinase